MEVTNNDEKEKITKKIIINNSHESINKNNAGGKGYSHDEMLDIPTVLLTNKAGGFFTSGLNSRYSGLFFNLSSESHEQKDVYKIIDEIRLRGKATNIIDNSWNIQRKRDNNIVETLFMPFHTNALVYELSEYAPIDIILDIRKPYDNREWGRNYNVSVSDKRIIVEFTKNTDIKDGETKQKHEYTMYLVIEGDENFHYKKIDTWMAKKYDFDKQRGSFPFNRHVYNAMKLVAKRAVFAVSFDKQEAIGKADNIIRNLNNIKKLQQEYYTLETKRISNKEVNIAHKKVINSLNGLMINAKEIYTGLPWSFHVLEKSEAIAVKALIIDHEYNIAKEVLIKQLQSLHEKLATDSVGSSSLDFEFIGWHYQRWYELISILQKRNSMHEYFTEDEINEAINRLRKVLRFFLHKSIDEILGLENFSNEKYIICSHMIVNMFNIMHKLTKDMLYKHTERRLRDEIRHTLWNNILLEKNKLKITHVIFVAAYIYPDILSKPVWEKLFQKCLAGLWLEWGGVSTAEKHHKLYFKNHSGENPLSHFNGDSWFWINNIAGVVLSRTNKTKFRPYIEKILQASTSDILWKGMIGHHSQLSSASRQKAEGCPCYAPSAAMYIELVDELTQRK